MNELLYVLRTVMATVEAEIEADMADNDERLEYVTITSKNILGRPVNQSLINVESKPSKED